MPVYDCYCDACGEKKDNVFVHSWKEKIWCRCGKEMKHRPSTGVAADVFPAEGIFLEHVSPEGRRFHSKKEMKEYAEKHDLELGAL